MNHSLQQLAWIASLFLFHSRLHGFDNNLDKTLVTNENEVMYSVTTKNESGNIEVKVGFMTAAFLGAPLDKPRYDLEKIFDMDVLMLGRASHSSYQQHNF